MVYSKELFDRLVSCLEWYLENDDTNFGMEGNEFWEEGARRAAAALNEAHGETKYTLPEHTEERYKEYLDRW